MKGVIMKIIKAGYDILTKISPGGIEELKFIEQAARVCYKSEGLITEDGASAVRIVGKLIERGHEAMLEHSQLTVKFIVDRGVSHELVRHRIASFAQESTRYCNYSREKHGSQIQVIDPAAGIRLDMAMKDIPGSGVERILEEWEKAMEDAERHYMEMIRLGASPQMARTVLPNSTKTELIFTANYREWRNFFRLRADKPAHPQMREVCVPLLKELKERLPVIFDDIEAWEEER